MHKTVVTVRVPTRVAKFLVAAGCQAADVTDKLALDAIARVLDGTEWDSGTLPVVADILRSAGRTVRDVDEADELVYCKYCYKEVTPDDNGEQVRCSECGAGLTPARM